jgi:adenine-specific DNA-methyltransferase
MRFLGNKTRLLEKIEYVINENNIQGEIFCDLFSGSSSVGDYFKDRFKIIANDYMHSLSVFAKGKLMFNDIPKFEMFNRKYGVSPFEYLNNKEYEFNQQYFITKNYSPKGDRQFFTKENALKIDGMRIEIESLYKDKSLSENEYYFMLASLLESVMGISNTTGTYEAFLKKWDRRALKDFEIIPLEFNHTSLYGKNRVFNKDSNELIREIEGDVLYIDPPYTITNYSSAYHLLESISKYDYPEIRGITGRRVNRQEKSRYTRKDEALINFEDLLRQAQFRHILISYSTQSLIPIEELIDLIKIFAKDEKVKVYKFPYREYKNIKSSQKENKLKEVVIYFEKDLSINKSPLNYTGSKDTIISDITKVLPKKITTFVDIMGGAFNVGANMYATERVIYNEFLPHVYKIISKLLDVDNEKIINDVEETILRFNLSKGNKESYYNLRKEYNKTKKDIDLFVLQMYCFQNQMRFNSSMGFNTPVGNCAYNETTKERILNFKPKTKNIELYNKSYEEFDVSKFDKDTLFYFDPPYFITNATYNDGKRGFIGWDADEETKLLEFMDTINKNGYKFILSNVIYHGDKVNHLLEEWVKTNNFYIKEINGVGSKNRRNEVLIFNYDWSE